MPLTRKQRAEANERAHKSLAETRTIDRYLRAVELQNLALAQRAQLPELEKLFVKSVKRYAKRKGIERATLLEAGVPERVLRKAGM